MSFISKFALLLRGAYQAFKLNNHSCSPKERQQKCLHSILDNNSSTVFGSEHLFASIRSIDAFRKQVPIQNYDRLLSYIDTQRVGKSMLSREKPCHYLKTSGTTQHPKFIPLTKSGVKQLRSQQTLSSFYCWRTYPKAFSGKQLLITGASIEGHFDNGLPFGSATGLIRESIPDHLQNQLVLPNCLYEIDQYELKYYLMALFAINEANITHLVSANPSSFIRLLDILKSNLHSMVCTIETGSYTNIESSIDSLPEKIRQRVQKALKDRLPVDEQRARDLKRLVDTKPISDIQYTDLWPKLNLITTWTSGSAGVSLQSLKASLSEQVNIYDPGYIASEGRFTVTTDIETQSGMALLNDHFYEFIERSRWDNTMDSSDNGDLTDLNTLLLHELKENEEYYLIITTNSGLYRYFMNDIIKVTGFLNQSPLFKFVQKGKGVSNLTGEKLYENQLLSCVTKIFNENQLTPIFIQGIANEQRCGYDVYVELSGKSNIDRVKVESLAELVDQALCEYNIEYMEKRCSCRLKPLNLTILKAGSYEYYKTQQINKGQRESQFKTVALTYATANDFNFDYYAHDRL